MWVGESAWPNYTGWYLIINHIWAAVIAQERPRLKGWCPEDEAEYFAVPPAAMALL